MLCLLSWSILVAVVLYGLSGLDSGWQGLTGLAGVELATDPVISDVMSPNVTRLMRPMRLAK